MSDATRGRAMLVIAALLASSDVAAGGFDDLEGIGWAQYDASYVGRQTAADRQGLGLAGLRIGALLCPDLPVGYVLGLDLHAGATVPAGFAYQADLYLLGLGLRLGSTGALTFATGVGASGATGTMDDAIELPIEANLQVGLGAHLRLMARAKATWLGASAARQGGTPTVGWHADELEGTVAVRLGRSYRRYDFPSGNGYFAGVAYREAGGLRFVGAVIGYGVNVASHDHGDYVFDD